MRAFALRLIAAALLVACGDDAGPAEPADEPARVLAHFSLSGSAEATAGATWAYRDTVDGVVYDLTGVLLKPAGAGPFPAVIVSHGFSGSATGYSRAVGQTMVTWGAVVIATNYTHAAGPAGAPGTIAELGASDANIARARRLVEVLRALGYVDMSRLAAHGHSMGAFVTAALVAAHPTLFRVASHTAGGVRVDDVLTGAAPTESRARAIRTPYQMHHGDRDAVVSLFADQRLDAVLQTSGVEHQLLVYPGVDHNGVAMDPLMLARVRSWYQAHGW